MTRIGAASVWRVAREDQRFGRAPGEL